MVHRPADSRLLTNLLTREKEYSKHLFGLLDYSRSSVASFSAYAAASTPEVSQAVQTIVSVLTSSDEALRKYAVSLERWQEHLKALKDLEDEVGNVMRDREILVTRLIKASKTKPHRDSILGGPSGSNTSLPFSKSDSYSLTKLATAQNELQSCEAHLAMKERELESLRTSAVKVGLSSRFTAMVECGWTWGEKAKEALHALESLEVPNANGHAPSVASAAAGYKPLPEVSSDSGHPSSDLSSLAPSQSASQIGVSPHFQPGSRPTSPQPSHAINIPPAHAITEIALPSGLEEGGSSAEEDDGPVEVHENPRLAKGSGKAPSVDSHEHSGFSIRGRRTSPVRQGSDGGRGTKGKDKDKTRPGLFGKTMAALFHRDKDRDKDREASPARSSASGSAWRTRTDSHLKNARGGGDSSDEETRHNTWSGPGTAQQDSQKTLKKTKRGSVQSFPSKRAAEPDRTYTSDGGTTARSTLKKSTGAPAKANGSAALAANGTARTKKAAPNGAATGSGNQGGLSRNNSLSKQSVASAPGTSSPMQRSASTSAANSNPRRRTISLDVDTTPSAAAKSHRRTSSTSTRSGLVRTAEPSLMSIVEGVARQNREAWLRQDPNRLLIAPKAPPPVNIEHIMGTEFATESPAIVPTAAFPPVVAQAPARIPALEPRSTARELNRSSVGMQASASAPSLPISTRTHTTPVAGPSTNAKALPKAPLRSALRSRSSSPGNSGSPPSSIEQALAALTGSASENRLSVVREDDSASVTTNSSYETGHEELDEEPVPPLKPAHDPRLAVVVDGSDVTHSDSSATLSVPQRRKSVRMSLPPTFSPTPPAIDDSEKHAPWSTPRAQQSRSPPRSSSVPPSADVHNARWGARVRDPDTVDMWQDSSDEEDADYNMAKRLLRRR